MNNKCECILCGMTTENRFERVFLCASHIITKSPCLFFTIWSKLIKKY